VNEPIHPLIHSLTSSPAPATDSDGVDLEARAVGMLSARDVLNTLQSLDALGSVRATVDSLLLQKSEYMSKRSSSSSSSSSSVVSVSPNDSVREAIAVMNGRDVGSCVVIDGSSAMVGIFTERDYLHKITLQGRRSADTRIADVMTDRPVSVTANFTVGQCVQLMSEGGFRHLPVLAGAADVDDDQRVVDMLSVRDLIAFLADQ